MLRAVNLGIRFLLELAALGAVGWWGVDTGGSILGKVVLGAGLPLVVAVVWGRFISPKASVKVSRPVWFALQAVIFGAAALALVSVWSVAPGIVFAIVVAANTALLERRGSPP
jgi:hypothetical protein